jgi:DNA-binding HxlR family transcriptional regulator
LAALSEQPTRFLALVRKIRANADDEILEGTIARSLTRLQQLGHIRADPQREGAREYSPLPLT